MTLDLGTRSKGLVRALLLGLSALALVAGPCSAAGPSGDLDSICRGKLDLKTLGDYKKFVDELQAQVAPDKKGASAHLKRCLEERDALVALRDLIEAHDKTRPCKMSEIKRLEEFARKHLLNNKRALALKFFSLFGVSVGLYCKINLMAHLRQADTEADQLDFVYSMASPTGWNTLINELTKKSMKFGTSGHQDSDVIYRIAKLVPGLSQVDHLDFKEFDHAMDDTRAKAAGLNGGLETGSFELKNAELRPQVLESLSRIMGACQNLDKFYVNSVLSLAKLRELGLTVDLLNDLHEHSALLHKWLAAASFCQLMARVRIVDEPCAIGSSAADCGGPTIKLEIIHEDKLLEGRRKLYSYAAPFDEIHPLAGELVWQAGVNEGSWRQKNEAMWSADSGQSVAMKQLGQFVKGVERDFQDDIENKR